MRFLRSPLPIALALGLIGCQPNAPIRDRTSACTAPAGDSGESCSAYSLEEHRVPGYPDQSFLLGFVEFDDQGKPYIRDQITTLFDRLEMEARYRDLSILVFVHGWKHNDAFTDSNVVKFRDLLQQVAEMELQRPPGYWPTRKVVGIYVGWRGLSFGTGDIGQDVTFWTRMATAHRVAQGSVREVLARAKSLRDGIDATSWPGHADHRSTRLVVIGHSFGGLIVYTALSQYFIDRVVENETSSFPKTQTPKEIAGYGDLVVVVNPAIEAMRYEPIRELLENGRYRLRFAPNQNPVFVEVTSDADWATGLAFPIGRSVNTTFESFMSDGERNEARSALGHYPAFWTHDLKGPTPEADPALRLPPIDVDRECADFEDFVRTARPDGYLRPGWQRRYRTGAMLTHRADSRFDPNVPFWIVATDKSLIRDHNDIEEPAFVDFIRQVYDDLVRLKEAEPCQTGFRSDPNTPLFVTPGLDPGVHALPRQARQ
jgi:hypothetical protein